MKYILKEKYLGKILIISSVIATVLPLYVILYTYPLFTTHLTSNIEAEAVRVAKHLLSDIVPGQTELSKDVFSAGSSDNIRELTESFRLMKLKIFSKPGEVIYSTDPEEVGQQNKKAYFHDVVAKGNVVTQVVQKNATSLEDKIVTADVVETYIPIITNGAFAGAFEIYYDITDRKERFDKLLSTSSAALVVLAISLWGATLFVLTKAKNSITRREMSEAALRDSEERFRETVELLPSIVCEYDLEARLTYVNAYGLKAFGYTRTDLEQGIYISHLIAPDEVDRFKDRFSLLLKGAKSEPGEYRLTCKDGSIIYGIVNSACKYKDGKLVGGRSSVTPITERKQIENALLKSEARYRLLIDRLPNVVFKGYKDGSVDFIDDKIEILTGYKKDEFNSRKMKWLDIVVEEDAEKIRKIFINALKTDKSYIREYRIKTKTGAILWLQEGSRIVCDENGEIEHVGGAFLDITTHRKMENQLQQVDRIESVGTLATGIAHDFNNLLMGIQGRASLMLMDSDFSEPHFEHLKGIGDCVKSAADLTKQLLGFARGGKYEVTATDLNEFIKSQNRIFGRTRKEININGEYQKNLWAVEVDQGQIKQVLLNIYVNAWQAMPGGGVIYIRTENILIDGNYNKPYQMEKGRYVKIRITDTGVGMDEATRQKVFDPFFTTKEIGRGTGLGLASAYGIIKNHDGFIDVSSNKGEGTTFTIYLPASEKTPVKEKKTDEEILKGTETVLIVDDENIIIDVSQGIIEKLGYKVLVAKSGKEAIDIYTRKQDQIHLVILDMIMPDMGGGDTYDRLKEINPDIKVLLSSGYNRSGIASEILERGCNGFIQKPFDAENLSIKIREILDGDLRY